MSAFEELNIIDKNWLSSAQGKEIINYLSNKLPFGLVEKPKLVENDSIECYSYKLIFYGADSVGKSALISQISMQSTNKSNKSYYRTTGKKLTTTYWPVKLINQSRVILFKLQFWEFENCFFDEYFLNSEEQFDAIIYVFSFTNISSLSQIKLRISSDNFSRCKFIIGTKLDSTVNEVSLSNIQDFETSHNIKIWPFIEKPIQTPEDINITNVALILNNICERLFENNIVEGRDSIIT